MKIGIIGAGKVGVTLGKYLTDAGVSVTGYYSKTHESADIAATFTNTKSYSQISALIEASDTLFLTTPDGVIQDVWDQIASLDLSEYILCHFSGSLSSHVLSGIGEKKAFGCSIHPMYAFSDKYSSYHNFSEAYLTIEGDTHAVKAMTSLFQGLGHHVLTLRSEDKIKYHAAAALASNEMIALMQTSLHLLQECGFGEQDSMSLLTPLVQGNIQSMLERGCVDALTGPVERCDLDTVRHHREVLKGSVAGDIYDSLAPVMLELAQKKHPDQDYTALQSVMEEVLHE